MWTNIRQVVVVLFLGSKWTYPSVSSQHNGPSLVKAEAQAVSTIAAGRVTELLWRRCSCAWRRWGPLEALGLLGVPPLDVLVVGAHLPCSSGKEEKVEELGV